MGHLEWDLVPYVCVHADESLTFRGVDGHTRRIEWNRLSTQWAICLTYSGKGSWLEAS